MGAFRAIAVPQRPRFRLAALSPRARTAFEVGLALFAGLVIGYAVARRGTGSALTLAFLIPAIALLTRRASNAVALAAGAVAVVPYWWTVQSPQLSIPRAALLLAGFGILIGAGTRPRIRLPDLAAVALAVVFIASFDKTLGVPRGILIETLVGIAFYGIGRLTGTPATTRLILWSLAVAGAIGGLSVMYEFFVTKAPLVTDSSRYGWQQDATYIYRPGGLYGSPPGAVVVLAMTTICALPLIGRERSWRRLLALALIAIGVVAIVLTFTRAGWVGFGAGALLYAMLSADAIRRRAKVLLAVALAIAAGAILVLPSVSGSDLYQKGVNRGGTLQAREGYWQLAIPLIGDTPEHLVIGRGFNALASGQGGGLVDSGLMASPQLSISGTHNQYVRTLVEHGVLGFALMLAWLLGACAIAARQARRVQGEARRVSAALAAAVLSFMIASLAGDTFGDAQGLALVAVLAGLGVTYGAAARRTAS
jgi:hypothetical protein